ncbi:MAG: TIGR04282 family arsenosugar biosynthesis glycosyltransferase [Deltaproteobacteria bacterium]|nr:TIGR04282 family arsenosugar biosynthesis glycosyltransferase [Deltaproteobacteria bacterium]MBW2120536.1 TIGR04282 family arsenosugar biosynthesis glycosyltransferase [Deltaproteobacteria bacterium]
MERDAIPDRLIVFTRYPEPGKTKTRLIPSLGPRGAAELQRRMTEHTMARARELRRIRPLHIEIRYDGGAEHLVRTWLGPGFSYQSQGGGDLGRRMAVAFRDAFLDGADRVVLVGTDCPDLTENHLGEAFDSLKKTDVVLGPARDGGYYLIGLRQARADLFLDMPWGTEKVLERTRQVAEGLGASVRLLEALGDMDRPEDLIVWRQASQREGKP